MAEPQIILVDHVRSLLETEAGVIALIEGRVEVIDADQLESDEYRGAYEVISRDDLVGRLGPDPGHGDLDQLAAGLTAAVQRIGG